MAQEEPRREGAGTTSPLNLMPTEFAEMGKKRIDDFVKAQTELFEKLQRSNKRWFDRMQSEVNIASELASNLTAAHSISDAMIACQEWGRQHVEMMTGDGKQLFTDVQKFMETGTRLLSNGRWPNGRGDGIST